MLSELKEDNEREQVRASREQAGAGRVQRTCGHRQPLTLENSVEQRELVPAPTYAGIRCPNLPGSWR